MNVHPSSNFVPSSYEPPRGSLTPTNTYSPPAERSPSPPRSRSQPPPASRKSVQFAEAPQVATVPNETVKESEEIVPERRRHRHKHSYSGGYEAEDDTDSTPDELRRGTREHSSRPQDPDSSERRHRRRRSHDPTSSRNDSSKSSKRPELERVVSPADSDATIELPPRFDDKGRKKAESGDDPLADKLDEILTGKGAAGKVFGNFLDGLFGPDGRRKSGR